VGDEQNRPGLFSESPVRLRMPVSATDIRATEWWAKAKALGWLAARCGSPSNR